MVVVTGAAGHLGNNLVRMLVAAGEKVRAFLMPTESAASLDGLEVEIVRGDIRDGDTVKKVFEGADTVYHVAGVISLSPKKRGLLYDVNVGGTKNVIEACKAAKVKRLVHTASVHAFADIPHGQFIDENTPLSPELALGHYGKSKALAVQEVRKAVSEGLNAVIVCPSGIIGPNDFAPSRIGKLMRGLPKQNYFIVPSKAIYDFVDVRDVAIGEMSAAKLGKPARYLSFRGTRSPWKT